MLIDPNNANHGDIMSDLIKNSHGGYDEVMQRNQCDRCGLVKLTGPIEGKEVCWMCADKGVMTRERVNAAIFAAELVAVCDHNDLSCREYYGDALRFMQAVEARFEVGVTV